MFNNIVNVPLAGTANLPLSLTQTVGSKSTRRYVVSATEWYEFSIGQDLTSTENKPFSTIRELLRIDHIKIDATTLTEVKTSAYLNVTLPTSADSSKDDAVVLVADLITFLLSPDHSAWDGLGGEAWPPTLSVANLTTTITRLITGEL